MCKKVEEWLRKKNCTNNILKIVCISHLLDKKDKKYRQEECISINTNIDIFDIFLLLYIKVLFLTFLESFDKKMYNNK